MYRDRIGIIDDPFGFVIDLVLKSRYETAKYLYKLIHDVGINDYQQEVNLIKNNIARSESSRR